ncbi:autotransporter outer membrane beta-barrel domain-containing protein [Escherichia coli]|uniref:S6 family peptidase n=1 Tax=Escherichia coli TaxID=562 RepID=UPI0016504F06|nr:S6 family peptidase [Escherichia coli]MBC6577762.1 autotransporter outer membrane beta-barrel domain-containing protein [Escherichia coli]
MNTIYSLRYSAVAGGLVAVPEFARKCTSRKMRKLLAGGLLLFVVTGSAQGSVVSSEVPYQTFRDFAENKGAFATGATNIPVYYKDGTIATTLNLPVPDFSSVNVGASPGVATLINPQYIVSVNHNKGYKKVSFGDGQNDYTLVNRNGHSTQDFHAPRLNKLVTEVAPAKIKKLTPSDIANHDRFTVFYRVGSGYQNIQGKDDNAKNSIEGSSTQIADAYEYMTGGVNPADVVSQYGNYQIKFNMPGNVNNYGAFSSFPRGGDSGSPTFAWDSWNNEWVLVAVHQSKSVNGLYFMQTVVQYDFINELINKNSDGTVTYNSSLNDELSWTFNSSTGEGALQQGESGQTHTMHGNKESESDSLKALDNGKDLVFYADGSGIINLKDSINQGAGSLTFNSDYTVKSDDDKTWIGAGLIINDGVTVNWQVNGVKDDNLHKIGAGTLIVNGMGDNEGGLKAGDGTVILKQTNGQAFNSVNIASGRPVVVIDGENQVKTENITWGYNGGMLDINGHNQVFAKLNAADYGAILSNNNKTTAATVDLDFKYFLLADDIVVNELSGDGKGNVGGLYKIQRCSGGRCLHEYYLLKETHYTTPGWYQSTTALTNLGWDVYGDSDINKYKQISADYINNASGGGYIYHGQFRGNININNILADGKEKREPKKGEGTLVLDGSADITGTFTQKNGGLTLQGHPVIHAYYSKDFVNKMSSLGDNSLLSQPTSFGQDDWERRVFSFGKLSLDNTAFGLGRNATLKTTIEATNSDIILGDENVYIDRNDGDGVGFSLEKGTSDATTDADRSIFEGSAVLSGTSTLNIRNAIFTGDLTGNTGTHVTLSGVSTWNITGNSSLDSFSSDGGTLIMGAADTTHWQPKTLTVQNMNASNMRIALGVSDKGNDSIVIETPPTGGNNVLDISALFGQKINPRDGLSFASLSGSADRNYFSFASVENGFSIYDPDYEVVEEDGKLVWKITKKDDTTDNGNDNTTDADDSGNSNAGTDDAGSNSGGSSSDNSNDDVGDLIDPFRGRDNIALLKNTVNMFSTRDYILTSNIDHQEQVTDYSRHHDGAWAYTSFSEGGYDSWNIRQSGLDFGVRKNTESGYFHGASIMLHDGKGKGQGKSDSYRLWGVSLFAGQEFTSGVFADTYLGYRQLTESFSVKGELNDMSGNMMTRMGTAGARTGWRMDTGHVGVTVTPSVSVHGVVMDSNVKNGNERSVQLNGGAGTWLKTGVAVEKKTGTLKMSAGLWRTTTLKRLPGVTLKDRLRDRHFSSQRSDRFTASFGVEGKVSDRFDVQLSVNRSFDGYFKTDCEGMIGIRYRF